MIAAPRVTVVIINWNYGRYIGEAVQSVKQQTYGNLECIIVDNGSTTTALTLSPTLSEDIHNSRCTGSRAISANSADRSSRSIG